MTRLILWLAVFQPPTPANDFTRFFAAVRQVESAGNDRMVGDAGRSRGPYQIQRVYWADACAYGKVKWDYNTFVWSRQRSEQVMRWYWQRHCPRAYAARDWKTMARIHNGGPAGARKIATIKYWQKVKRGMK